MEKNMTITHTIGEQWRQVIDDYLGLVELQIKGADENGKIPHGYSVACLLLSAIDGIGHGISGANENHSGTRLDIITDILDSKMLKDKTPQNLASLFRNGLVHAGIMAKNVTITGSGDKPFYYNQEDQLVCVNLPVLFEYVNTYWKEVRLRETKTVIKQKEKIDCASYLELLSTETQAASGCVMKE